MTGDQVVAAYNDLYQVERSFRMTKSDLSARSVFHRLRDSIDADLTVVFARPRDLPRGPDAHRPVHQQDREDTPAAAHRDDHTRRPTDRGPTHPASPTRRNAYSTPSAVVT